MKVGDYVRTKKGIEKIICIEKNFMGDSVTFYATDNDFWRSAYNGKYNGFTSRKHVIIKSSPNIVDLLKKKDLVVDYDDNIYQVTKVWKDYVFTNQKNKQGQFITLVDYQIKSIVTKEQFSQMEYKIGR